MTLIIKLWVILVSLYVTGRLFTLYWQTRSSQQPIPALSKIKLATTGLIANIADTIGVGSFAVMVALNKHWRLVDDQELPGTLNAHSTLPAMCQALFFLQAVHVEMTTLVSLIIAASFGGFLGGFIVAKLDKHRIRRLMMFGYVGIAATLLGSKLGLLPVGGSLISLHGASLLVGIIGMLLTGALPAIGVGAYAPTQVILFLLGMSPLVAFPIMTASAAIQQSVTALAFIQRRQCAVAASCIMSLTGVVGVFIAAPLVTFVNPEHLRWLLFAVVLYNIIMLKKSLQSKAMVEQTA